MPRVIKLTETDLVRIVKKVIAEQENTDCEAIKRRYNRIISVSNRAMNLLPKQLREPVKNSFNSSLKGGNSETFINSLPKEIKSEFIKQKQKFIGKIKNLNDAETQLSQIEVEGIQEQTFTQPGNISYLGWIGPAIKIIAILGILYALLDILNIIKPKASKCGAGIF